MKKGLTVDGDIIEDANLSKLEYVRLLLLVPKGSVFGHKTLGYKNSKFENEDLLKETITEALKMANAEFTIDKIQYKSNNVIVTFKGTDLNLTI